jgi:hypothetical protein
MFGKMSMASIVVIGAFLVVSNSASAASLTFESTAPGFYQPSLSVTNVGLTLTATTDGNPNGFVDVGGSSVGLLGSLSVIGSKVNPLQSGKFDPLRFTFSQTVGDITFAFGDNGGDSDSPVKIDAYNSANVLLGSLTDTYPAGFTAGKTISGNFAGAIYFVLSSGSEIGNENSLLWEVPSVTPSDTPEPASLTIALIGFGSFAFAARRRRKLESTQATVAIS